MDTSNKMRVAVVTPYHKEDLNYLKKCHQSVVDQTYPCTHVLVADGFPIECVSSWKAHHVILPVSHGDIGSTPRLIGCYHSIGLGVDAIAFLDADNWYSKDHIEILIAEQARTEAAFISSGRMLCRIDGSPMGPCPLTNPNRFIDTNCMLFTKDAFYLLHQWVLMPDYGHLIGDRIMLYHVKKSGIRSAHVLRPSVNYRCSKDGLYRRMGEEIPDGVQPRPNYEESFQKWIEDGNPPL